MLQCSSAPYLASKDSEVMKLYKTWLLSQVLCGCHRTQHTEHEANAKRQNLIHVPGKKILYIIRKTVSRVNKCPDTLKACSVLTGQKETENVFRK